jgi:hypothetical protein
MQAKTGLADPPQDEMVVCLAANFLSQVYAFKHGAQLDAFLLGRIACYSQAVDACVQHR